jgi:hypothetical protein
MACQNFQGPDPFGLVEITAPRQPGEMTNGTAHERSNE